ncbi:MAG: DUF559 domain-containing protein [Caulobacter sp.]|nr:DUF559 domain-containing protein [Caulobacter sp.]
MTLRAIDHVQIAIPVGGEAQARPFYGDLLGLTEVPKPTEMAKRGGAWFEGAVKVHLGVEQDFRANVKAHVAFVVDDRLALAERAKAAGFTVTRQGDQIYIYDPFGNRLEFVAADTSVPSPWRGEGGPAEQGRMGVGSVETQKPLGLARDHPAQQRGHGATPNPGPSPLQGEGKAREKPAPGGVTRARRLRRGATHAERLLWAELRKLKTNFRRQAPIGRYVADFVHHASKLVIEIDGPVHDTLEAQQHDAERTAWLRQAGYRVIRFSDRDVADRLEIVVDRIAAEAVPPPSDPAPRGHLPPSRGKAEARYEVR